MKIYTLALFFVALTCTALSGQINTGWFLPGSYWEYSYEGVSGPGTEYFEYTGTAYAGGQLCTRLHWYGTHAGANPGPFDYGALYVLTRNDSVFWWKNNAFQLLYDFTRKAGQSMKLYSGPYDYAFVEATGLDSFPSGMVCRYQDLRLTGVLNGSDTIVLNTRVHERLGGQHLLFWDNETPLSETQYNLNCYRDQEFPAIDCGPVGLDPGYTGFPEQSGIWSETEYIFFCSYVGKQYKVEGDTTIWGLGSGKKVYSRTTYSGSTPCPVASATIYHNPFQFIGLLQQSLAYKKIYFTRLSNESLALPECIDWARSPFGKPTLLYDFDLDTVGVTSWELESKIVFSTDSIQLNDGSWRKVYHFDDKNQDYWIEGIGSRGGLLGTLYSPIIFDVGCDLRCFRADGILQYNRVSAVFCDSIDTAVDTKEPLPELSLELYPNPGKGLVQCNIPADDLPVWVRVFDAQGQLIESREIQTASTLFDFSALPGTRMLFFLLQDSKGRLGRQVLLLTP